MNGSMLEALAFEKINILHRRIDGARAFGSRRSATKTFKNHFPSVSYIPPVLIIWPRQKTVDLRSFG
jgi:hypothetical protein